MKTWKVERELTEEKLQSSLNKLTDAGYTIFKIYAQGAGTTIVAYKEIISKDQPSAHGKPTEIKFGEEK